MAQLQVCRRSLLPSMPSVQRGNGDRKLLESSLPRSLPLVLGRDEMIWGVLLQSEGLAWCLGWGERISAQILLVFWVKTTKTKKKIHFFSSSVGGKPSSHCSLKTLRCLPSLVQGMEFRQEGDLVVFMWELCI